MLARTCSISVPLSSSFDFRFPHSTGTSSLSGICPKYAAHRDFAPRALSKSTAATSAALLSSPCPPLAPSLDSSSASPSPCSPSPSTSPSLPTSVFPPPDPPSSSSPFPSSSASPSASLSV
ncbi:unnamed protein product [Closterium sp. NIES-53]